MTAMLLATTLLAACKGTSGPTQDGVPESDLTFVVFPDSVLPLVTKQGSFWAVKGQDRAMMLRYQPEQPGEEGESFLEFKVPGDALLKRPDGTAFAQGDSVQITVQVSTDGRFLFEFSPAGLQFDPNHPARLDVTYSRTGGDLDGDGTVDQQDQELQKKLGMWKQEAVGGLWYSVGVLKLDDLEEIEGDITGFTGFALAG
ncbi:MAG TPA: hypothetical protein VJ957_06840 [Longimicrobiales bacterium]|nr:hypothetical protein [Longimicrobiales bacterium]